jgi:hypothetical protein
MKNEFTKTTRGDFGKKTFTTFCFEKNSQSFIEATAVNNNEKSITKYNPRLSEISNHKRAIRHLIIRRNIDVGTKKLRGFPVLSKNIDFLFFEHDSLDIKIKLK